MIARALILMLVLLATVPAASMAAGPAVGVRVGGELAQLNHPWTGAVTISNIPPNEDQVPVHVQATPGTVCGSLSKVKVADGHFRYSIHCVAGGTGSRECNTPQSALGLAAEWGRNDAGALDARIVCGAASLRTTATWGDPSVVVNRWQPLAGASTNGIDCIVDEWRMTTFDGGWSATCSLGLVSVDPILQ